jgi:hypothetical protein
MTSHRIDKPMKECKQCKMLATLLGKRFVMPLLGHHYPLCRIRDVNKAVTGLHLQVVGGLTARGWTTNDIDVIGDRGDIGLLAQRLKAQGIVEPIHFCGSDKEPHSHLRCAFYGIKLALTGKGY